MWNEEELARRVGDDLSDATYVNLGLGLPQLVADYVSPGREVLFHSENGLLGIGEPPLPGNEDWECIDAGKRAVTLREGGSYFDHATSFSMIRGRHLDVAILGAYEVSCEGDLANWRTMTDCRIPGVGGAMDLAVGAKHVYVVMHHVTPNGEPRLIRRCSLPLTGRRAIERIYTDLCVSKPDGSRFCVLELAPDVTRQDVVAATDAPVAFNCVEVAAAGPSPTDGEGAPSAPSRQAIPVAPGSKRDER